MKTTILTATALAMLALSACTLPPVVNPEYSGEITRHVMSRDELNAEYKRRGGTKKEVNGFFILGSEGCEYWIAADRVGTSTENHEQWHCANGNFHR